MKPITKIIVLALVVLLVIGVARYMRHSPEEVGVINDNIPVSITKESIEEQNFSGSKVSVAGSSIVARSAKEYVEETVSQFKSRADSEVPELRKEFGEDAPPSHYTIDINGTYIRSATTESIVLDQYVYTGGANGSSSYKVFTASLADNVLLPLSALVKNQDAFVAYVKKTLMDKGPEGSGQLSVFEDDVKALSFVSFSNWSLDPDNLTIYFDKYAIGPGALGAVAFPLPLSEIKQFMQEQ
jgi:hypothetical protein